jgi:replicative DNA helicase
VSEKQHLPDEKIADTFYRQPPFDLQAELGVLGSCFVMPKELASKLLPEIFARLEPENFYDEANGKLFGVMRKVAEAGKPLDPTVFVDAVKAAGIYDEVGGLYYLSKVTRAVPSAAHVTYYADIVADKAFARRVIVETTELLQAAYDQTIAAEDLAALVDAAADRVSSNRSTSELPIKLADSLRKLIKDLRKPASEKSVRRAFFGIPKVDEIVGAVHAGEVCVIAARPGMGKTALGVCPLRFAASNNMPSLLVSLEMEDREIASREVSRATGIDNHFIRSGDLDEEDLRDIEAFARSADGTPFYTWDTPSATLSQIRAVLLQAKNRLGITVAAVDYIALVDEPPKFRGSRRDHLAAVSRGLKKLAKELQIPIFVLCQLNREKDRPNLTMLAECGAIEQDADSVIFLHAESTDDPYREVKGSSARRGHRVLERSADGPAEAPRRPDAGRDGGLRPLPANRGREPQDGAGRVPRERDVHHHQLCQPAAQRRQPGLALSNPPSE